MAHAITNVTQSKSAEPVASQQAVPQKSLQAQPKSTTAIPKDTVTISNAAQSALQQATGTKDPGRQAIR